MQVEMRPSWKSLISPLNTATTHEMKSATEETRSPSSQPGSTSPLKTLETLTQGEDHADNRLMATRNAKWSRVHLK